jgi:hypothetical protein
MLSSLFDEYSLNARVRPALLALLSLTVFFYLAFPQLYSALAGAVSIFVVFGSVTALAHYCRSAGRNHENKLFSTWGGKPTTSLLRHRDTRIDPITKNRYHEFLSRNIAKWVAPSAVDELNDPQKADQAYDSAVRWLLEYTRDQKRYPLLFKENISYGFRRNCYGIKWLAAMLTLVPIIAVVVDYFVLTKNVVDIKEPSIWLSLCLAVILSFWWVFVVRESWVRDAATAYAIRLLAACETDGRT